MQWQGDEERPSTVDRERRQVAVADESAVADFLGYRPHYDREHVEYIARRRAEDGTPYCRECHDWHFPNEQHSMMDGE